VNSNITVQTETRDGGAAWTGRAVDAFGIDAITANRHPSARLRPRGDGSGDGSGIDLRQPRLISRQPIGLPLIRWRRAGAAASQKGGNALGQQLGQLPHFTVLGEMQKEGEFLRFKGTVARYTVEKRQPQRLDTLAGANATRRFDGFEETKKACS